MNARLALLLLVAAALPPQAGAQWADDRIWLRAELGGSPVQLLFDTGATWSALTRETVRKLGLQLMPPQTNIVSYGPGVQQPVDLTKAYFVKAGNIECPMVFAVIDMPSWTGTDFAGVLGWLCVTNTVVSIDAMAGGVSFLDKVPPVAAEWSRIPVASTLDLVLKIPHSDRTSGLLEIDTGADNGVALPPQAWSKWKKAHPDAPLTLWTDYTISDGPYEYEEAWADSISFGPITLNDVPIGQAPPSGPKRLGKQYEGTIGLAALKRLELVVDAPREVVYWRLRKSTYSSSYSYNRLGAVFRPTTKQPDKAVARVIKRSPAYAAGVRDGDVLLEVDGIKTTSWRGSWMARFNLPAGTKLKLTLDRKGKIFQTTATLTEILQPNHSASQQ